MVTSVMHLSLTIQIKNDGRNSIKTKIFMFIMMNLKKKMFILYFYVTFNMPKIAYQKTHL